ncbi:MAG TPA: 50S ribosomal protein L4 [Planctomycetaceae bacterium]|nr:50S ribosomal protein L4 [Planctomycetaceae bacterium]HRF00398.1 50S ribosomal protein L4 [Pirellulaceae bacterium]
MVSLPVYDKSGKEVGKYEIDPAEIAPKINRQMLHDVVVMYQANQRLGTHKTKTRGEVRGSTKKLYRQKGTGNARVGSKKSGTRRGGGHIHAKHPLDYSYRMPKKMVKAATRMAIAGKIADREVVVIDDLSFEAVKTRQIAGLLKALSLDGKTALIATEKLDPVVYKSSRNIPGVEVLPAADLNALAVIRPDRVLVSRAAMDAIRAGRATAAVEA